jgi:hypothetical protein
MCNIFKTNLSHRATSLGVRISPYLHSEIDKESPRIILRVTVAGGIRRLWRQLLQYLQED